MKYFYFSIQHSSRNVSHQKKSCKRYREKMSEKKYRVKFNRKDRVKKSKTTKMYLNKSMFENQERQKYMC